MKPRRLTVTRTHPEPRHVRFPRPMPAPLPLLRLQGRWMDQAGFAIGKPVRVYVLPSRLLLEVIDHDERD